MDPTTASRSWIAVASAEHVRWGRAEGFMQVCHGKAAPLRRIRPGDRVAYYSPTERFQGKDRLQSFTAVGIVRDGTPYPFDMGGGFVPFRRDVRWLDGRETPILPLLDRLDFSAGVRSWGYPFRFGLFTVTDRDLDTIAAAMGADLP
ncbi:EVE domain-containing protein [Azospirillum sp. Marseille-Q6669]